MAVTSNPYQWQFDTVQAWRLKSEPELREAAFMMRSTLLGLSLMLLGSSAVGVGCGDDDGESPAVGGSSSGTGGSSGTSGTGGASGGSAGSAGTGGASGSAGSGGGAAGAAGSGGAA